MIDAPREVHLAIIRKHYPGIALGEMTLNAGGEHYIYSRRYVGGLPVSPDSPGDLRCP